MPYSAYLLTQEAQRSLIERCSPRHPEVIAHHVTHAFPDDAPPPEATEVLVIGYAQDSRVDCVVVEVHGSHERPSGGVYHVTLSVDRAQGGKPVHSNRLLKRGWTSLEPFRLTVTPTLVRT